MGLGTFLLIHIHFLSVGDTAAHNVELIIVVDDGSGLGLAHMGGEWAVELVLRGVFNIVPCCELLFLCWVGFLRDGVLPGMELNRRS